MNSDELMLPYAIGIIALRMRDSEKSMGGISCERHKAIVENGYGLSVSQADSQKPRLLQLGF